MSIAAWADRHARSILFLVAALVIAGAACLRALPVSLFPHVDFPRLRVNIDAGEQPAEQMMIQITKPIEQALRALPGVRGVQSATSRGGAEVWLTFDWGNDMTASMLQAESCVNQLLPSLPSGTKFGVLRMEPTVFPVIAYSLTSATRSLSELHDIAQYELSPLLSRVQGVARISIDGGAIEEWHVIVDPAKLAARGLAISDIAQVLGSAIVLSAVGQIEDRYRLDLVITDTRLASIEQIGETIVRATPAGGIVRLSDVAVVRKDIAPRFVRATSDGREAVLMNVYQQPGANTIEISKAVHEALASEQSRLPAGVKISNWYDQSDLITASANSVRDSVIIGVSLAAIVLFLFLRDWRITLIAALSVPLVLTVTALILYLLHESLNIMTLGGMAAAVGLIIDDAIVMSEHIVRRLAAPADGKADSADASRGTVLKAADEFSRPLVGSSLSTIIIHIPPAFLIGVTGAFFAALSLAMASSLIVSLLIVWFALPTLAARFLHRKRNGKPGTAPHAPSRGRIYPAILQVTLAWPAVALIVVLPILAGGYLAFTRLPSDFMPTIDEGGFVLDYVAPPGTSLTETDRLLNQVEDILRKTPDVLTYSRRTGLGLGGDLNESNAGDFFVRLKATNRRPTDVVMKDVQTQIEHTIPGLDCELAQLMKDLLGDLSGKPEPIVVNLFADDESLLISTANKLADVIARVPGAQEIKSGVVAAGDALDIHVDPAKAAIEGTDAEQVSKAISDLLSGNVATQVQRGEKLVDVRIWTSRALRKTPADLAAMKIRAADGHLFPLSRVATFQTDVGQPEITRDNLKRVVSITGRSDRDLGSTIRDVQAALDAPGVLPPDVRYTLGGLYEQQQIAFKGLIQVMIAGGVLVFLLLLFLYESFRVAFAIVLTSVTAIAAVFIGMYAIGIELNISSLMGVVMIVGNVTEVAIFYFSEFIGLPNASSRNELLIEAGTHRLRAITMTSVAAILALAPLAIGIGEGSGMLQPLAGAIIIGLAVQLPLVLIVLPGLLALMRVARKPADVSLA